MSEVEAGAAEASSPEQSAQEVINTIDDGDNGQSGNIDVSGQEEVAVEEATDEELQEALTDEDASAEEIAEVKEEIAKRLSLKINGQEREFDLSNDMDIDALREMAQKGEGADQKFQEAATMRKQMEKFVELMQNDPIKAMTELGLNPDDVAEMHMQKRIEEMQKSPEQLELEKLRAEIEAERQAKEELEKEKFEAEQQRIQDEYARQLDNEISDALNGSELPKSPYVVKRVAENLMIALEKDSNASVSDIMPLVQKQIKQEIRDMFGVMPEDIIEQFIGEDVSTKLRKRRIKKMKKAPNTEVKATGKSEIKAAQDAAKKEDKPTSAKDFFKSFGDL